MTRGQLAARASGAVGTPIGRLLHACARAAGRMLVYGKLGLCYIQTVTTVGTVYSPSGSCYTVRVSGNHWLTDTRGAVESFLDDEPRIEVGRRSRCEQEGLNRGVEDVVERGSGGTWSNGGVGERGRTGGRDERGTKGGQSFVPTVDELRTGVGRGVWWCAGRAVWEDGGREVHWCAPSRPCELDYLKGSSDGIGSLGQ